MCRFLRRSVAGSPPNFLHLPPTKKVLTKITHFKLICLLSGPDPPLAETPPLCVCSISDTVRCIGANARRPGRTLSCSKSHPRSCANSACINVKKGRCIPANAIFSTAASSLRQGCPLRSGSRSLAGTLAGPWPCSTRAMSCGA